MVAHPTVHKSLMNSDSISIQEIECKCVICEEWFDENDHRAIVFSCGHTFGKACALRFNVCPICKQPCDASIAPPNYMLEQFIEMKKTDHELNSKEDCKEEETFAEKCFQCTENSAELFCVDCDVLYCKECDQSVHQFKVLANHLPRIEANVKPKLASDICSIHENEKLLFFCVTCDIPICRDCKDLVIGNHHNHKLTSLSSAVELTKQVFFDQINSTLNLLDLGYSGLINAR
jgi:tripartite motif-containing protein 56